MKIQPLTLFLIIIALIILLIKQLLWTFLVPIWQTPDEQAHFAQLQWYAEKNSTGIAEKNLSVEVAVSEDLLGTRRDVFGNNKFTYHPNFKIDYTNTFVGEYENLINNLPKSSRTTYVDSEAAMYPPLYYLASLPFYNSVYNHGLIDRVFAVRLFSLIINLLIVFCAYLIGKVIWGKGILPVTLAALVAFQPMMSFVASGVHPDNLLNLFYSIGILFLLLTIKNGVKLRYLLVLALVIYLGFETKPLMLLLIPLVFAVLVYRKSWLAAMFFLIFPIAIFFLPVSIPFVPQPTSGVSFIEYLHFRAGKTLFEIWPWYWGVFKWLGVSLPPLVVEMITRIVLLAAIGVLMRLYQIAKSNDLSFENIAVVFFLVSSITYFAYLITWDWRLMQTTGFSAGLQGRYFFPNIVTHMALIIFGLTVVKKWTKQISLFLVASMIALNIVAFYTVAKSYYDVSSKKVFLMQAAQYKPAGVKAILKTF